MGTRPTVLQEDPEGQVKSLEEVQRATLNILEDFDAEKKRLEVVQTAALNILEDFGEEKKRLEQVQTATVNILEDFDAERARLGQSQRALLNILEDIDVEKAKVAKANQQLEVTNKELEAFTYSVAHDLRAPLRHIDGFSRILEEECASQLDSSATRYLQRIREGTHRMGLLVDDLLNLSRIGRQEIRRQATGLNSLVTEVQAELQREEAGRQIEWRIGALPFADCDPILMKQVFANLLSNAVKYTRPRTEAVIEVGTVRQGGETVVFVRDNGVGFSMKYADKLFGVFQRLHRQEDFEGTGVGLATVQRIVHKHGGRIWAEAELDRGATFYFTLGAADQEARGVSLLAAVADG
jgi:light-regulated signal transduction histidine kinase (bacteriophytochrome)